MSRRPSAPSSRRSRKRWMVQTAATSLRGRRTRLRCSEAPRPFHYRDRKMTTSVGLSHADQQRTRGRRATPAVTVPANPRLATLPIRRTAACACGGGCPRCESARSAELAPDAEASVSAADASLGAALPTDVQDRFGSRLGTNLDQVRVHTGAHSQAAADALSARAYTIGNDIHFAAAQYQP